MVTINKGFFKYINKKQVFLIYLTVKDNVRFQMEALR